MNQRNKSPFLRFLGIIGAMTFLIVNWWPAFSGEAQHPQLSSPPTITKEQAVQTALTFTASLCGSCTPDSFAMFHSRQDLSGYLQKNHLSDVYLKSLAEDVPIDYFQVDVADQQNGRHYFVDVHPHLKKVIGWRIVHAVQEEAQPSEEQAKVYHIDEQIQIARDLMIKMGNDANAFTLHKEESSAIGSDDGSSRTLVFNHRHKTIGQAVFQLHISVKANIATSFHAFMSIPGDHKGWLQDQSDMTAFMSRISLGMSIVLFIASAALVFRFRKTVSFASGVLFSMMFAVTYSINNINLYPGFRASLGISTQNDIFGFIYMALMQLIIILIALSVYFSIVAGKEMWSKQNWDAVYPEWHKESFGIDLWQGMGRGYLLCLFLLGVQSLLFLIAENYWDMWATNDPATSPHNMLWPFLFPLLAWAAAISEETVYRLFGINLFRKLLRNTFLAVLVPSIIWALGHTQYSIFPVYTRLIEVTILGIVFGYAFLKFGFITVLFAHAIMDSILMSFSLMSLGGITNILIGIFYIGFPALIAWILSKLHSRFRNRHRTDSSSWSEDRIT